MTRDWGPVAVRARGLSSRLLDHARLLDLARAPGLPALGRALPADRRPPGDLGDVPPVELERSVRRHAADLLAVLGRWADSLRPALAVVFQEEDLRSVRALVRGAAGSVPSSRRLAGLLPTPTLPEAALADAAHADTPAEALTRLAARGHPDAADVTPAAGGLAVDLFRIEAGLARGFARRSIAAARRGGRELRAYVAGVVDLENAWSAILAGGFASEVPAAELFLEGGRALDRARFLAVADATDPVERRHRVADAFARTPLAAPFAEVVAPMTKLEALVLRARIDEQTAAARRDPLGPAPVLAFALRLRAQVLDLQAVLWGIALAAPPAVLVEEFVAR